MSIIYDALKKVEAKSNKETPTRGRRKIPILVFFGIGCILFIIFSGDYVRDSFLGINLKGVKKSIRKNTPLSYKKYTPDDYVLEGVVYDGEIPLAIINGEVLGEHDRIGSLEIISITSESVQLIDIEKDSKVTLTF